jgi:ectoine hydroxylase-related dioxygenase (phytanoyl-CoA dioxygenase family)
MRIQISPDEYDAGKLTDAHVSEAVDAIENEGYVVLGGVVSLDTLDAIKPKLDEDTGELLRRGRWGGAGHVHGHLQQSMPRKAEYIHRDIVTNPLIIQVTAAVLGEGLHNHFYNGNTNMPGSGTQPLHRDSGHLWPGLIHPTTSIVINISPVDVNESNGATEIWPGTHKVVGPGAVPAEDEEARRAEVPPVRAVTQKGDAILRDIRMWHRGVPNNGSEARHMIGMVHSRWFYFRGTTIPVSEEAAHAFDDDVLTTRVEIAPSDYDYLDEFIRP